MPVWLSIGWEIIVGVGIVGVFYISSINLFNPTKWEKKYFFIHSNHMELALWAGLGRVGKLFPKALKFQIK